MNDAAMSETRIEPHLLRGYYKRLVNQFFKILPIREREEASLGVYMRSLRAEMLGCQSLAAYLNEDGAYMTLLAILQYLIDRPDCPVQDVKREVFKAIRLCDALIDALPEETGKEPENA